MDLKTFPERFGERLHIDGLWARIRPYAADEPLAARFRARQLQAVLRLTPLAAAANLLNALLIVGAFWGHAPHGFLLAWCLLVGGVMLRGLRAWQVARHAAPRERASQRALHRATVQAALLGALWSTLPLALFPLGDSERQLLLATVTTGMICAGGFALATVPAAGTAYVVTLGTGAAIALFRARLEIGPIVGGLLLIYCVIVIASVWATARLFGARMLAEAQAERHNEVIGLLLRDFEEHASDVLWETGPDGHLRHVSPKLESLLGRSAAELAGQPAARLLRGMIPADGEGAEQFDELAARLTAGAPFRDLALPIASRGRTYWWSLTAKPLSDSEGRAAGWRGVATNVTATRRANRQLTWLAHNDALTGLCNRHQFRSRLAALLPHAGTAPLAVLCLDLDHFKGVNDTLGHASGDVLLRAVGERLLAGTRREDLVARLGGDEFAVLLHGVGSAAEATPLAQRLLDGLRDPCEVNGSQVSVRTSLGIAIAPADGEDVDTLLNHADLALYAAKAAGRGELRFFQPEMATTTRRRLAVEQALRDALARRELRLVFQPQVLFGAWRITGFEALLRWQHSVLGEVSPTEFIPVAEEAGLMPAIGEWVLHEACRHAAAWPGRLTVAVNVSPVQAMSRSLAEAAPAAASAAGLAPQRLELEITESIFLNDSKVTMEVLHGLRRAGIRIALDDFGTGYSALGYLRRFPFDKLKIDRSFVRELLTRGDARAIVKTIIGLARTLGMSAVAEGVEEPAHASVLHRYGCDALQGYLVSRPLEADAVAGFLERWRAGQRPAWQEAPPTVPLPLADTAY